MNPNPSTPAAPNPIYDLIIIGAGPAGMTAGIYAARKKLRTLVLTRDIGGQTAWSSDVENYPGFTMMRGTDLVEKFEEHLEKFKDEVELRLTTTGVAKITTPTADGSAAGALAASSNFVVTTADGKSESARSIILAGGKLPRKLGVPGEDAFLNKGVTYCAWCDGPLFAGKDIAIIGGGNAALDSALNIDKIVKSIYIVNLTEALTADPVMVEKIGQLQNIRVMNNCETRGIKGDTVVRAVTVADKAAGGTEHDLPVEGVFIEVGSIPATDYLKGVVELDKAGEVVIDGNNMTSVPGIFAAGDITTVTEKQIVIAAGEGAKAAICASQWLSKKPA